MLWEEAFGLLLLVVGTGMIFAIPPWSNNQGPP